MQIIYILLNEREVLTGEYWSSFLFTHCMDRAASARSIQRVNKERDQYSAVRTECEFNECFIIWLIVHFPKRAPG